MENDCKQQTQQCRRRERGTRSQRVKLNGGRERDFPEKKDREDTESPNHSSTPQKTTWEKRHKEGVFEEDVIDGFKILSFLNLEDLENTILNTENENTPNPTKSPDIHLKSKPDSIHSDFIGDLDKFTDESNLDYWNVNLEVPDTDVGNLTSSTVIREHRISSSYRSSHKQTVDSHLGSSPDLNLGELHSQNVSHLVEENSNKRNSSPVKSNKETQPEGEKQSCNKSLCDHLTLIESESISGWKIASFQTERSQTVQKSEKRINLSVLLDKKISAKVVNNHVLTVRELLDVSHTSESSNIVQNAKQQFTHVYALHPTIRQEPVKALGQKTNFFNASCLSFSSESVNCSQDSLYPTTGVHQQNLVEPVKHSFQNGEGEYNALKLLGSIGDFNSVQNCVKDPVVLYPKKLIPVAHPAVSRTKSEEYLNKQSFVYTEAVTLKNITNSTSPVLQNSCTHFQHIGYVALNPRSPLPFQRSLRDDNEHHPKSVATPNLKNVDNGTFLPTDTCQTVYPYKELSSGYQTVEQPHHLLNKSLGSATLYSISASEHFPERSSSLTTLSATQYPLTVSLTVTTKQPVSVVLHNFSSDEPTAKSHHHLFNCHSLVQEPSSHQRTNSNCKLSFSLTKQNKLAGQLSKNLTSLDHYKQKERPSTLVSSSKYSAPCYTTARLDSTSLISSSFSRFNLWTGASSVFVSIHRSCQEPGLPPRPIPPPNSFVSSSINKSYLEPGLPRVIPAQDSSVFASANRSYLEPGLPKLGPPPPNNLSVPVQNFSSFNPHQMMFAPVIHPTVSLPSASLSLGITPPFAAESLFSLPSQDLLRRELDTRFLASHNRSINIPPPPYMTSEFHHHQHQHTHMHQHGSFLSPPPFLHQPIATLLSKFDKLPKLETQYYGRSPLGLSNPYKGFSPFLGSGVTPYAPPSHVPTFQPKPGRWCAMHVHVAWEIYKHQHQTSSGNPPPDVIRSPSHLFPRPQEFSLLTSPVLPYLDSSHGRIPHEGAPINSILTSAANIGGVSSFVHTGYHGFVNDSSNSYPEFGTAGAANSGMFGSVDLTTTGHPTVVNQDPWNRLHSFRPLQPDESVTSIAPCGGLKAEAHQEPVRIQWQERNLDQEQEKEKNRRVEVEKERKVKEDKERDREKRGFHHLHNINGIRKRESHGDKEPREVRETSRSPVQVHKHNVKTVTNFTTPKSDIKVEEEQDMPLNSSSGTTNSVVSEHQRAKTVESTESQTSDNYLPQNMPHPHFSAINKTPTLQSNIGSLSISHLEQLPLPYTSLPSKPTVSMTNSAPVETRDPYRLLGNSQGCGHDQIFHRYFSLHSVMPFLPYGPFQETEHAQRLRMVSTPRYCFSSRETQTSSLHPQTKRLLVSLCISWNPSLCVNW
ncbi:uncharacterized protein LOC143244139 isoform X4 [Tachypleus tridentatus]|uniref:uncharacterized protein LOC143244139 isoform X4 n=1 Tax=Tachypleus tridentatus TaxID=6853 RepID=UPI003FD12A28